jgi:glycosyltransferase involved in cell wall biosynthesis
LWSYLPENRDEIVFLSTTVKDQFAGWGKLIGYYPRLLRLGWIALKEAERVPYDLIVAWEGKCGFPLAMLRRLNGQHNPPLVILAFSIRGPLQYFPWLKRFGVGGADYFSVPTSYEQRAYADQLGLPLERVCHLPIGTHDIFGGQFGKEPGDFVFSGGRSGRDYATLMKAFHGLDIPLVVNARPFNLRGLHIPPNVQVNDLLPAEQYREHNWNARFVIVPLRNVGEAVGLTAILYAMAAGKAVICTDLPGPAEYVHPGVTGLLVSEGDEEALRASIHYLWERPELCREMGRQARALYESRYTFTAFAQRVEHFLHEVKKRQ